MSEYSPALALVVPYRNRRRNLHLWLDAVTRYEPLRRLSPSIHVVCQANTQMFNRGRLLNIGFALAPGNDCYCFHDVDLVPVSADYTPCAEAAHLSSRVSQFGYRKPYDSLFGGVTLFGGEDFSKINGFSNQYLGWGGEDDDLLLRCRRAGFEPEWRDGIFYSLHHGSDYGEAVPNHGRNLQRLQSFERSKIDPSLDGLSNLSYTLLASESMAERYAMPVTIHHVGFNNRDLDADLTLPASFLKPRGRARLEALGGGFLARTREDDKPRWLNEQAAAVLQLCDGSNTIDQITRLFSHRFLDDIYDIELDVPRTVGQLFDLGLCEYLPPTANEYVLEPFGVSPNTITVTTHDRPHYFRGLLDSLAANDTHDYHLVVASEPGCAATRELSESFPHPSKTILYNPMKLGVRWNPYSVLDYVFINGASFNLYLEEDLELAIDAVDLANWFQNARLDPGYLCLCLHNGRHDIDPGLLDKVFATRHFSALGIALGVEAWDEWLRQEWFNDEHARGNHDIGWDHSIRALLDRQGLKVLFPVCSRARHTGRYGTHCGPELQDRVLEGVKVNRARRVRRYFVVDQ